VRKTLSLRQAERSLIVALLRTLRRQALHAAELELTHPITGELLHFESAIPEDMARALALLQAHTADRNP
jgi:23S rRNA pseudouridine1911/1915/1917 synthase